MARISLSGGMPGCQSAERTGLRGYSSSSIYLRFINTKTRQPVGFQSTDIAD
jgi:hypothetical protein